MDTDTDILQDSITAFSCDTCFLCGSAGVIFYKGLSDHMFDVPGDWNINKCKNADCGLFWLDPMPAKESIGALYKEYYTHDVERSVEKKPLVKRIFRQFNHAVFCLVLKVSTIKRRKENQRSMYLAQVSPGKVLEVGCGRGETLNLLRKMGWEVQGQEIDPLAASAAISLKEVNVHIGELETLNLPSSSFDAVVMNHVIEHVHNPVDLLTECYRLLKQGGQLVMVTPNMDSFLHNKFKQCWRELDPPRHFYLFSEQTIAQLANRAGFAQIHTWTTSLSAQAIAHGSYDIVKHNRHDMAVNPDPIMILKSGLLQLQAMILMAFRPGSGESCVVRAIK